RPHREEHLAADEHRPADVDERLVAHEGEVADAQRGPGITVPAAAEADRAPRPDARAEERTSAAQLEVGTELRELADRDDLFAEDRASRSDPHAVLEDDPRRGDERALAELDAVAYPRASASQCRDLVGRRQTAKRVGIGTQGREEAGVERTCLVAGIERRGQRDAFGRDAREDRLARGGRHGLRARHEVLDVLLRDEAALLDGREIDAVQLRQLDRLPRRLPVAGGRLRQSPLPRTGVEGGELLSSLGDERDRLAELDLD